MWRGGRRIISAPDPSELLRHSNSLVAAVATPLHPHIPSLASPFTFFLYERRIKNISKISWHSIDTGNHVERLESLFALVKHTLSLFPYSSSRSTSASFTAVKLVMYHPAPYIVSSTVFLAPSTSSAFLAQQVLGDRATLVRSF